MIKAIALILVLFAAIALGHTLIGYQGSVIIATESTVFEMTLISASLIAVLGLFLFYLVKWLVFKIVGIAMGSKNWLGSYSRRQQDKNFFISLNAYLMGDKTLALKHIGKTYGGDFHGANYLLAADMISETEDKQRLFAHASSETDSELAAAVNFANQQLHDSPEQALETLKGLPTKKQSHIEVIRTKLKIYEVLNQWEQIRDLITSNKKQLADEYIFWAHKATHGEFSEVVSKEGANALKEKWSNLSRAARKDLANQSCFVRLLIEQGLSEEAEAYLIEFSKKNLNTEYWPLFKQLNHAEPVAAKGFMEGLIKKEPENAEFYSVLAHLAYNSDDYELAAKTINKALELRQNKHDTMLLAAIFEKQNAFEKANTLYKQLAIK